MDIEKELVDAHEWYKKVGSDLHIDESPLFLSSDFLIKFTKDGEYANMETNTLLKTIHETLVDIDENVVKKVNQMQEMQKEVDDFKAEIDTKKKSIEQLCLEYVAKFRKEQLTPRDDMIEKLKKEVNEVNTKFAKSRHKNTIYASNALITMHNNRPDFMYYEAEIKDYLFEYISFFPGFFVLPSDAFFWKSKMDAEISSTHTINDFVTFIVSTWCEKYAPGTSTTDIIEYIKNHLQDVFLDIDSQTRTGKTWDAMHVSRRFENPAVSAEIDKLYGVDQVYYYVNTIEGVELDTIPTLEDYVSGAMAVDLNKMDINTFIKCPRRFRIFDVAQDSHPFVTIIDPIKVKT
jgi:Skp family chaperone for outer membrane proteins